MELTDHIQVLEEKLRLLEFQNRELQNQTENAINPDGSEWKRVEEELRKSEARFRAYFENNTSIMLQIDAESKRIMDANDSALTYYGYSRDQFKKLNIYDLNKLSPEKIDQLMLKAIESPAQKFIFTHQLASGESREIEAFISPIITETERQLFVTIYDVSERESNKRALEESERKLREAQRIAKIGNWEYVFETKELYWSAEIYAIFETDKSYPLNNESYNRLIHPDDLHGLIENYNSSVEKNLAYHNVHRIRTQSGKIKYVEERGITIYDETGKPIRSVGTTQDITEHKTTEIELKKSQEYLNEAQRIAKVGHFEHDLITKETNWSDEVSRIFGFDLGTVIPNYEKYRNQIHPDNVEELNIIFNQALQARKGYSLVYQIISLDEKIKYVEEKGYFGFDRNQEPIKVIGTIQDITTNYLIQKALEESREQLALINQNLEEKVKTELMKSREKDHLLIQQSRHAVLGEMIGNIAHQWRQPLNEVSLLVNDLEDAYAFGVLSKEYFGKTMEIIYRRLKYMSDTINDFSKMHLDDFKVEAFYPKELIKKLIQFSAGTIKKNKIQIRFMCNEDFEVFGYPNMLSHVLLNLLSNSRDILIERSIKKPKIWIKLEQNKENYCIRVLDNGKGVDRDVIEKIFDPYFSTKDKKRGSGLGLYMAKSMIEKQMHGQIQVQNQRDGAEFKITLNLKNDIDERRAN